MLVGTGTRERILLIAQELFTSRGYAATSVADIAAELGTSKAALYHHFESKEQILSALLARPLAGVAAIAEYAATQPGSRALLERVIDVNVSCGPLLSMVDRDPSVLHYLASRPEFRAHLAEIEHALAGDGGRKALIRARAAFTVAKELTLSLIRAEGALSAADRREVIGAAERALGHLATSSASGPGLRQAPG